MAGVRAHRSRATPAGSRSRVVHSADRTLVRPNAVGVQWDWHCKQQMTHISETTGTGAYCHTDKKIAREKAAADTRYDSTKGQADKSTSRCDQEYPPSRSGNSVMAGNRQAITQPSIAPTTKVAAGGVAGALTVLVVWILGLLHVTVPPEVASALTVIISFISSYLIKQRIPAAAINPSTNDG